ncbi:MAG: dihydroorotase [Clostridia bacterium]|nr:dihydroorotase [Clostridia bacterium]
MKMFLKDASVYKDGYFLKQDLVFENGHIIPSGDLTEDGMAGVPVFPNMFVFPGFVDVHVHLREPGFIIKETIESGTAASARGGYVTVCSMPNLNPPPDSMEQLNIQLQRINETAKINVIPFGTITKLQAGLELADMEAMAPFVAGFSDDGRGVQSEELMLEAMQKAKKLNKIISAHCEDNSLLFGGYIHDGEYAKANGHKGICSESEWGPIKRDIELAKKSGCKYHVCHISTKESVELIRNAKADGVNITCETAPHYLVLDDTNLKEDGRFKMNPPLRSPADREALIMGLKDGTIDMIATDHAPHTADEKSKGLSGSLMGVVGIETAFAVMYTKLVKTGVITLEKLIELMAINPRKRFDIPFDNSFTVWDLNAEFTVDPNEFLSKGRATPFEGEKLFGRCVLTATGGKTVYKMD